MKISRLTLALILGAGYSFAQTPPSVLTQHNDISRSGWNNSETILTLTNVNQNSFKLLFTHATDGQTYAQPLYVPALTINSAVHNVVFVATENNSVYAFDADSNSGANANPLWHISLNVGTAGATITAVSSSDVSCTDLQPIIGITSTPVIDPLTKTMYVVAKTKEVSSSGTAFFHRLHAINLLTGQETLGGPVAITATVPGSCGNTDGKGNIVFNAQIQHQRASLLLSNGIVYIGFGSHCDLGAYNGWFFGYNASTLAPTPVSVYNTSVDGNSGDCRGAIWQSGSGPAADASGNLYALTGNGTFNVSTGGKSYGDSVVRFSPAPTAVSDYFTPFYQKTLDNDDYDVGSGGPLLLPDQPGSFPHLEIASGKVSSIYLVNRDSMGGYNKLRNNVVQEIPAAFGKGPNGPSPNGIYANGVVYFGTWGDFVRGFTLSNGKLVTPSFTSSTSLGSFGAGLSASSTSSGANTIIWALDFSAALLHAYNGTNLTELYNSGQAGSRDSLGTPVKFAVPTVSNGKVYVGTASTLAVYGNF